MTVDLCWESVPSGVLRCVGTVIWNANSHKAVVIDPTDAPSTFTQLLSQHELVLEAVLLTHGHVDHAAGACAFARGHGLVPYLHHDDWPMYFDAPIWGRGLRMNVPKPELTPRDLEDGQRLDFGDGICLRVFHTPGHTPGQVAFVVDALGLAVVGDTLFYGSVGRTDLPGGNHEQLVHSIRNKLYALADDTLVIPGHGPRTTIGREKQHNPHVKAASSGHP